MQRGGNAHRQGRCLRGSPLPSQQDDNTTFDVIFTRPFYPEVPNNTPFPLRLGIKWILSMLMVMIFCNVDVDGIDTLDCRCDGVDSLGC
jgi:hypothetical protein